MTKTTTKNSVKIIPQDLCHFLYYIVNKKMVKEKENESKYFKNHSFNICNAGYKEADYQTINR